MKEYTNIKADEFCCVDLDPGPGNYGMHKVKIGYLYNAIRRKPLTASRIPFSPYLVPQTPYQFLNYSPHLFDSG